MAADLPAAFTRPDLEEAGFVGWRTWDELRDGAIAEIPGERGVYLVFRESVRRPSFVAAGSGGRFKGRDPNVPVETLKIKWVPGAHVLYLGKADLLPGRVKLYERFGAGRPAAHWGGRYIWQIPGARKLHVAWRALTGKGTARDAEIEPLAHFRELHDGHAPFADLTV